MKPLKTLSLQDILQDKTGNAMGTVEGALKARQNTIQILESFLQPQVGQWPKGTDETYEILRNRALPLHECRRKSIETMLESYLKNGFISIEDGGIKSEDSLKRKIRNTTETHSMARASDLSRIRIVAKDLRTLLMVTTSLQVLLGNPTVSEDMYVAHNRNTYKRNQAGKSLFSGVFLHLLSISAQKIAGPAASEVENDIVTEVQIVTQRVRDVMECNRENYADLEKRNLDASEYNKAMLCAILLDWKEYFAQQKKKR